MNEGSPYGTMCLPLWG